MLINLPVRKPLSAESAPHGRIQELAAASGINLYLVAAPCGPDLRMPFRDLDFTLEGILRASPEWRRAGHRYQRE